MNISIILFVLLEVSIAFNIVAIYKYIKNDNKWFDINAGLIDDLIIMSDKYDLLKKEVDNNGQ